VSTLHNVTNAVHCVEALRLLGIYIYIYIFQAPDESGYNHLVKIHVYENV